MSFWQDVPTAERVNLFDLSHISFILTVFIILGLFIWQFENVKKNWQTVRKILIVISAIQIVALYSWSIFELGFDLKAGLPIHLCRMSTFLGMYFLITEDTRVFGALFYMSVFALVAIFYPVNVHPIYTHIIGWSYQISHIMILLVWIIGVFHFGYRPTYKGMFIALGAFFIIELLVWRFNIWVDGGEYLYILSDVNRPFFKSWHDIVWILFTIGLSFVVMLGMTIPFNLKKNR